MPEYGYNQNIGIYDADYVNGSGQSYEGIIFTDGGMEVMYYNQLDERWADVMYGTSSTIGQGGCGPTSMAIVVSTLTGDAHDPVELAQWSVANGHRCEGNGWHSIFCSGVIRQRQPPMGCLVRRIWMPRGLWMPFLPESWW